MLKLIKFLRNVASPNRNRRFYAAKLFGDMLVGDFRVTWHQLDWWYDPQFSAYLRKFGEAEGMNTHRHFTLWNLLRLTARVEGDTAECGVFEGASSWLICAFTKQTAPEKKHHLFDSFEGLSEPDAADGNHWTKGDLAAGEEVVTRNLKQFSGRLCFHKGWIPDRFPDVADRRFSFVHVDVDLMQPTRESLNFFYDRLSPGAVFLCDDYACTTCPGATTAIDEFLEDRPEKMLSLDAGGGFFIKGVETAARLPIPACGSD